MLVLFIDYQYTQKTNGIFKYRKQLSSFFASKEDVYCINVLLCAKKKKTNRPYYVNNEIFVPYDILIQNQIAQQELDLVIFIQEYISKHFPKEDVVFHINWFNHVPLSCLIRKIIPSAKIILTKHCVIWREHVLKNYSLFYSLHSICSNKERIAYPLKLEIAEELYCFEQVDAVITVTVDAYNLLCLSYGIDKKKVFCIHNGIAINDNEENAADKVSYGFNKEDKIIIYAGTISLYKGLKELLDLFSTLRERIPNIKLLICGGGDFQRFFSMLRRADFGRIHFTGNLNQDELRALTQIADIAIVPSLIEQCSFSALEFLASNVPTVLSQIDGLRELSPTNYQLSLPIEFTPTGVSIKCANTLGSIIRILETPDCRQEIIAQSHDWIRKNFSIAQMCNATYEVYQQLFQNDLKQINNNNEPLVSVIIPCYNGEKYICECIRSVTSQTYKNIEIIIINDASEDETLTRIQQFSDYRIKVLSNSKRKGIAYSLNKGIKNARGKYIARLDSDDVMLPHRIRKQVDFLEEENGIDFVGSNHFVINEIGLRISYAIYPERSEEIELCRFIFNPFSHPTMMLRRSILLQYMYNEEYSYCEDYYLWMTLLRKHKGHNLQEGPTLYRCHNESVSTKKTIEQREQALQIVLEELAYISFPLKEEDKVLLAGLITGAPSVFWQKYRPILHDYIHRIAPFISSPLSSSYLHQLYKTII